MKGRRAEIQKQSRSGPCRAAVGNGGICFRVQVCAFPPKASPDVDAGGHPAAYYGAFHLVTTTSVPAYISGKTALRPALKYYTPKTLKFVVVDIQSGPK